MEGLRSFQPRDRELAARVVSTLAAVAGSVTVVFAALAPGQRVSPLGIVVTVVTCLAVIGGALLLRRLHNRGDLVWAVFPFAAISAIVALDLLTRDASVAAQVFFFFPALYAGFQLRRVGAAAICAAAVAGDLVVVFALLDLRAAAVVGGYLAAALITSTSLLVLSGERQDELVAQLRRQAAVDPLTGLMTRRMLDNAATAALTGAASDLGTGLILLDVDRFKSVNDEYGHPAGDEVLVQLADLLMLGVRPSDTVSRLGGDEVAILLAGCSMHAVQQRAEQILWEVRAHQFRLEGGVVLSMSVSIGVAHLPTHGVDLRGLYCAADGSLYAAKRAGRNQIGPMPDVPIARTA